MPLMRWLFVTLNAYLSFFVSNLLDGAYPNSSTFLHMKEQLLVQFRHILASFLGIRLHWFDKPVSGLTKEKFYALTQNNTLEYSRILNLYMYICQ